MRAVWRVPRDNYCAKNGAKVGVHHHYPRGSSVASLPEDMTGRGQQPFPAPTAGWHTLLTFCALHARAAPHTDSM